MSLRINFLALVIAAATLSTSLAQTEESPSWTQFRGNEGLSSVDAQTPSQWTEDNYVWKVELPGRGWSSPVYANNEIWLTAATEVAASEEEIAAKLKGVEYAQIKTAAKAITMNAICVDLTTGQLKKVIELGTENDPQPNNPMNSYASPTCAIADGKVICHFGAYGTWCIDAESKKVAWDRKFVIEHSVGPGSSPIIDSGKVILVCDGIDDQFVAAIDLETGSDAWKTDRPEIVADSVEFMKAYSTPVVREIDGVRQAVVPGANWICSYNVETGEEVWRAKYGFGFSVTPMAVFTEGNFVISTGYGKSEFVAVKPGSGDVSDSIQWRARNAPAMASFVAHDGVIYATSDRPGVIRSLDAKTGEVIMKKRFLPNVSASILKAGEHLYIGSRDGIMKVVKCDPELEEVSSFDFGSPVYATPVVVENDLLVRTKDFMVRIGK
jgi:outer membrane protein assembly factor BamB